MLVDVYIGQRQARYGLWVDPVAKRRRGELLARHLAFEPASRSVKGLPSGMRSGKTLFCAALGTSLEQVMANASELAARIRRMFISCGWGCGGCGWLSGQ